MGRLRVLYDGWPLAYEPNRPSALHLQAVLAALPWEVEAVVAAPAPLQDPLPATAAVELITTPATEAGRLGWEQRALPGAGRRLGAGVLHLVEGAPALFGGPPALLSPCGEEPDESRSQDGAGSLGSRRSLAGRLREALLQGGRQRLRGVLWPADLPHPGGDPVRLPPAIHPLFRPGAGRIALDALGIPQMYVLYHGPRSAAALERLLAAWSWAAGAVGAETPLIVAGLDGPAEVRLEQMLADFPHADTVRGLPVLSHATLAALYRECAALFHPAEITPWGNPVRMALAAGRPVVALETPVTDVLVGPAGYLASGDPGMPATQRALGAALVTVLVEESVAGGLAEAARRRSAGWDPEAFGSALLAVYLRSLASTL